MEMVNFIIQNVVLLLLLLLFVLIRKSLPTLGRYKLEYAYM